jgi:hypothetical protein
MTEPARSQQSQFVCDALEVHFIYTFNLKAEDTYLVDPERIARSVKEVEDGVPNCRKGIAPHLEFKSDSSYVNPPEIDAKLEYPHARTPTKNGEVDAKLGTLIRLFPTGCTCSISVRIPRMLGRQIDPVMIRGVLSLVRQRERSNHISKLTTRRGHKAPEAVYSLFVGKVRALCRACKLTWLEEDADFIDPTDEVQTPWVVTVAEVSGAVAEAFCSAGGPDDDPAKAKMLQIRRFEPDIAEIVFRSVSEEFRLEPAYVTAPTPEGVPGLFSVNVDARLFVNISRRSILCICRDVGRDPARYFVPGLLDICEMMRVRWHSLIMMNKVLDEAIRSLRKKTSGVQQMNSEEQLSAMMHLRDWLATSLEEPAIYVIAGDALSKIYEDLRVTFRIADLREMAAGKIEALDKMYQDYLQREWVRAKPVGVTAAPNGNKVKRAAALRRARRQMRL